MKQKLLTDIELDTHELKYLMEGFLKEPTDMLSELLKRNISRMQRHLSGLLQEIENESETLLDVSSAIVKKEEDLRSVTEEAPVGCADEVSSVVVELSQLEEQKEVSVAKEEPEQKASAGSVKVTVESAVESVGEQEMSRPVGLGEALKLSAGSLRRSISLNDSFRFSRELFGGDMQLLNRVIEQLSMMNSYQTAVAFLASKVKLDEENDAVNDFLELLRKYFN